MGRTACTEPQCLYKGAPLPLPIPLLPLWAVRPVQSLSACTRVHFTVTFTILTIDGKVCGGNTANRSGDEICALTLSKGGESNNTRNVRKAAHIYMAISILAVTCRVHLKYSMFARHGAHTIVGCDVTYRDNGLVTLRQTKHYRDRGVPVNTVTPTHKPRVLEHI